MLAALSPASSNYTETLGTLRYASRAKSIKVNAVRNEEEEGRALLSREIERLKKQLTDAQKGNSSNNGMDEIERMELEKKYKSQIAEFDNMMKQTWEDKEKLSKQHEESKRKLKVKLRKEQSMIRKKCRSTVQS